MITLKRIAYTPMGTFGRLVVPGGFECFTVERPWEGNKPNVSCIPEGAYTLRKRHSGVVQRTTNGEFNEGWEVTGVHGRTYVMLHPGNHMDHLEGCIAPGEALGWVDSYWAVTNSRNTFRELMAALEGPAEHTLDIRPYRVEYP